MTMISNEQNEAMELNRRNFFSQSIATLILSSGVLQLSPAAATMVIVLDEHVFYC